jgi:ankyrin repeat protein
MLRSLLFILTLTAFGAAHAQTPPSKSDIASYTGLLLAAHHGHVSEIERLITAGADINVRDKFDRTPAHVAAFASQNEAMIALAKGGVDMNTLEYRAYDVVTIAAVANDPKMVSLAISLGNRADLITSVYDGTALIAAAHLGHHEVVSRLVAGGAPLDHVNNLGWTALIEAVVLGDGGSDHVQTVKILIDAGADKSIADRDGITPLRHAKSRGYGEIIRILE